MEKSPEVLKNYYNDCFMKHGDNNKGADWPNQTDLIKRYKVMSNLFEITNKTPTVLDFGCGTAMFYDFLLSKNIDVNYIGIDINENIIETAKQKNHDKNAQFFVLDIIKDNKNFVFEYDYAVCNGTFTEKRSLSQEQMFEFVTKVISSLFSKSKYGIAFNVMSDIVDYRREDLFHIDFNTLMTFVSNKLTRNFTIRNDYGLYEYTVYLYKGINI